MEVNTVLSQQAAQHIESFRKSSTFLRQLSGQNSLHALPTMQAIEEGLQRRWHELSGLIERRPLNLEVMKAALRRVIAKTPPSGPNNEQFRDCCLWEASIALAADRPVHLVSNDSAFYENRDRTKGLADQMREETERAGRDVRVSTSVRDLMERIGQSVAVIDEPMIASAIVSAVMPRARSLAATHAALHQIEGRPRTRIKGYATPKPSQVAVSFEVTFPLKRIDPLESESDLGPAMIRVGGTCSYDPISGNVFEVEIDDYTVKYEGRTYGTGLVGYLIDSTRTEYI
jgi:hypothetical protein